ncbi:lysozyme inhibitor LprI family protein [Pontibacter cellulosilyticus]|uniref:DUF1311 domain-containing protein n=1 Tax=Pontibacter cellulosilyticus TaxID=1720253 RepID=A0A923N7S0_9BACT|nr:lysozyme inhibitor LprI family protein [Pontibacter cellulosilyticus]MBC5993754.1 DUF1311 domain-containing protein [Pontibacter cellulosilyticus]
MRNSFLLLFLTFAFTSAWGQGQAKQNCEDPQTQLEMNICAAEDFKRVDAELNKVYKEIVSKLEPNSKGLMVKAQKSWLVVRDNHCGLYEQFYQGGSIMPLMLYTCKTELTQNRIKELRMILREVTEE